MASNAQNENQAPFVPFSRPSAPLAYTSSPWQLLRSDFITFIHLLPSIFSIITPIRPWPTGFYDELFPSPGNLFSILNHVILFITQSIFILSTPLWLLFPVWMVALYVLAFILLNQLFCYFLNGSASTFESNPAVLRQLGAHADEEWIFINGVAVGRHWMQANIDRLSLTFQRPVRGAHNRTAGILFDVIQCLIERTFDYCTTDVRICYEVLKLAMSSPVNKVVLILHSQGGIQGGLIVDWLLEQLSQEKLSKLEIYTFGCAANHFNNPRVSAKPTAKHPTASAISYIEHYANEQDFVARWGILHSINPLPAVEKSKAMKTEAMAAAGGEMRIQSGKARMGYQGRVFEVPESGHLMNQHYLDRLFPLDKKMREVVFEEEGGVQDMHVHFAGGDEGKEGEHPEKFVRVSDARYPFTSFELPGAMDETSLHPPSTPTGPSSSNGLAVQTKADEEGSTTPRETAGLKVRDLSRLYMYVNGGSPPDSPVESRRSVTF
ncbi:hypothetical protein V490_03827 [Pseudogymnoascus sp. VKM F-3557]|nr:hypothetical protein V490_03827 [Pseudogymnoascus sp. VKM F-3557]